MSATDHLQALLDRLTSVRDKYGEQVYNDAAKDIARQLIAQGGAEAEFAREAFKDVPGIHEPLPKSDEPTLPRQLIDLVQQTMPGIKSQAQFDAFMSAFEGLRIALNGVFVGDLKEEADGKQVMYKAFDVARKATEVTMKLEEVPEAATSEAAEKFKTAPKQFEEGEIYRDLMLNLAETQSYTALISWYEDSKPLLDRIVTQALRNDLFDAIRKRKAFFQAMGQDDKETSG